MHVNCRGALFGLVVSLLSSVATAGPAPLAGPSQAPAAQEGPPAKLEEYVVRPGDVLQVFVWKEADLTRDVPVRLDGMITVPLLGDIEASGRTTREIAKDLGERLSRFVSSPAVTVSVTQSNSSRFFVIGQVASPGGFPLNGRITVLQALALAGGLKEFAKSDKILVIRGGGASAVGSPAGSPAPFNYKRVEDGSDLGQNIVLRAGDTILVP